MADIKYNVLALKQKGLTSEDIAKFIAQDQGKNYDFLVTNGLTPDDIIKFGNEVDFSTGEVIAESFKQGASSTIRGVSQLLGKDPTDEELLNETRFRQMAEQSPWAAYSANIAGNVVGDPTNLIPGALLFKGAKTAGSIVGRLGLLGGLSGALEPVYDPEEDSRLANVGVGAAVGGVLGGAGAKLFGVGKMLPDAASDVTNEVKPRYRYGGVDDNGEPIFIEVKPQGVDINGNPLDNVGSSEDSTFNPANVPSFYQNPVEGVPNAIPLPKLPQYLSGAKPNVMFGTPVKFETDLDKALYIVGRGTSKSKNHDEYMSFLTEALGLPENKVTELATSVRQELVDKTKQLQKQAGLSGKKIEDVPFQMSKTLDNFLNPVNKTLDEFSEMVYNTGVKLPELNGKPRVTPDLLKDPSFQKITEAFKAEGLASNPIDIAANIKGYNKMLDELKSINGRAFKPRSFEDYVKNNLSLDEHLDLIKNGAFDGCPL